VSAAEFARANWLNLLEVRLMVGIVVARADVHILPARIGIVVVKEVIESRRVVVGDVAIVAFNVALHGLILFGADSAYIGSGSADSLLSASAIVVNGWSRHRELMSSAAACRFRWV
jgi:hypothetical protein